MHRARLRRLTVAAAVVLAALAAPAAGTGGEGWISLFDGKTLTGWKQYGGKAPYEVKDGAIVGTWGLEKDNSFLATVEEFGDFVLEAEFRPDAGINSGVQFRSHSRPDVQEGRVQGYQYEIDPTPRALTGGLYEERGRRWLVPKDDPGEREAFKAKGGRLKAGEWNEMRVECRGPRVRTWLNGELAVDYTDDQPRPAGFIALQVHSNRNEALVGKTMAWRNLRLKRLD